MLFDDIEVLLVLSKAKSLSQAAGQLYMSRPGLSQKLPPSRNSSARRSSTGPPPAFPSRKRARWP